MKEFKTRKEFEEAFRMFLLKINATNGNRVWLQEVVGLTPMALSFKAILVVNDKFLNHKVYLEGMGIYPNENFYRVALEKAKAILGQEPVWSNVKLYGSFIYPENLR